MFSYIKYPFLIFTALMIFSCDEDFLETRPTDAISAADALATEANLSLVINGMHRTMYAQGQTVLPGGTAVASSNRAGDHYWVPLGDNLAGGLIHSANANNLGWRDEAQWTSHTDQTSLTVETLWYHRYNTITNANSIINKVAEGELPETPTLNEIVGQAYAYRAFSYLSLVQHYSKGYLIGNPSTDPGVPLLLATEAPFESAPRGTVQQVYDQINADLDAAISSFENASARPTGSAFDKANLNIDVAWGLKARTALATGDWATAATAAVNARQDYPIMGEDDWKAGFNTTLLPEVMWGSNVITTETTFFRSYFYLASNTFNGSQVRNNPKIADRRLIDAAPDTDYRKDMFLVDAPNSNLSASNGMGGFANNTNPLYTTEEEFEAEIDRLATVWGWTSAHNTHPYMHVKLRQQQPGGIEPDDIIYMRASEMYLIEAEAKAMMDDLSGAQEAIRPLGEERDSAYDPTVFDTQEEFIEHIKFQRGIELWGEGFLFQDKIRWDDPIDHAANGGSGASEVLYQDGFFQEKPSMNPKWVFKIPLSEINANPNLTSADQNP
ncbi:RagB/SusD family nutrient uptake outer membrane protein [Neolewinella aurantiaca]|uniref:RagB/SusD family nutrient uptake outer membrane protein n=1 Tax=Neolewinella aurantiaca TaxID=2602767 RepID=A0A5C7FX03_9BACT|nr:RagB/SusD family nutrient uptake outer membrane protein [Neolewinella aurantiaca]TXF91244.1 RagB/SusD family nutrient uptake outer membrane protein [Neolewinella aurantiaca]